jgi:phosphoglycolate phosphatase-like HAD superfamily hydrolase
LRTAIGLKDFSEDLSTFVEPTSASIFDELVRKALGRPPTPEEIARVQAALEPDMRNTYIDGRHIPPTAGAIDFLNGMAAKGDWNMAIATGNWRGEAQIKIESAGLPMERVPMATSSDRMARRDVLKYSVEKAAKHYGFNTWDRVVYVGDAIWDVRAARACGISFLGIGTGERAAKLKAEGAGVVLADFLDGAAVEEALERAGVPAGH